MVDDDEEEEEAHYYQAINSGSRYKSDFKNRHDFSLHAIHFVIILDWDSMLWAL